MSVYSEIKQQNIFLLMNESIIFPTEIDLQQNPLQHQSSIQPSLGSESAHPVSKRLRDLCTEMDQSLGRANVKFEACLDNQRNKFFKAYKNVIDQVLQEFTSLQKKFDEYIIYYEQDFQQQSIQDKLIFFRSECQVQQDLSTEYRHEIFNLKAQIFEMKSDNKSQHDVMVKQANDKLVLQQKLEDFNLHYQKSLKSNSNQRTVVSSFNEKHEPKLVARHKYQTSMAVNSPRTVFVYKQVQTAELRDLWSECVEETRKAVRRDEGFGWTATNKMDTMGLFLKSQQTLNSIIFKGQACCNHSECPMNFNKKVVKPSRRILSQSMHSDPYHSQGEAPPVFVNAKVFDILVGEKSKQKRNSTSYDLGKYKSNHYQLDRELTSQSMKPQNLKNLYQLEFSNLKTQEQDLFNSRESLVEQIKIRKEIDLTSDRLKFIQKQMRGSY